MFIGDGYSYYSTRDRHYRVEFCFDSKKDTCIINRTIKLLKKMGLNPFVVRGKRTNALYLRTNSKWLFNVINKKSRDFLELSHVDFVYFLGVLSGIIDSDGYVGNGKIVITQNVRI